MNKKILIIASITLLLDQITKSIIATCLKLNKSITIIPHFFYITYCQNEGAAWGLFKSHPIFIIIGTIIAMVLIYHFMFCFKKNIRNNLAFGLLVGGLAGNLCDRLFFGYVRDFLDFYIFNYDYPVFNVADTAIVIGVILLIIAILKGEDINETNRSRAKSKTR